MRILSLSRKKKNFEKVGCEKWTHVFDNVKRKQLSCINVNNDANIGDIDSERVNVGNI